MIAQLEGTVSGSGVDYIVLKVSGVGYRVHMTIESTARAIQDQGLSLWTHLSVRETSLELYGFYSEDELSFFEMLISVSGIGPKSALGIMNLETVETLSSAISQGDTTYLTKVSGIGKKSAEKIIIELRDKIVAREDSEQHAHAEDADALEALQSLGYSVRESREALKSVSKDIHGAQQRITEALKVLGK